MQVTRASGFSLVRQRGSPAYYRHPDGRATVVPMHKGEDLGRRLIRAILRDVDLSPGQFENDPEFLESRRRWRSPLSLNSATATLNVHDYIMAYWHEHDVNE